MSIKYDCQIGLLSTGDEVVSGDILNKNAQAIASVLEHNRFIVKSHLAVRDDINYLVESIQWLLSNHKVIITTGGLGPTLDDLTIDAVSTAIDQPVEFIDKVWTTVQDIHKGYGITCPDNNKRLARFVKDSKLLSPINGTAHGSIINYKDKIIIILPGPPKECMPMLERDVISYLTKKNFNQGPFRKTFFLFAASESHIASFVEPLCTERGLQIGFRASFPYLEIKIFTQNEHEDLSFISELVTPWYLGDKPKRYETIFLDHWSSHNDEYQVIAENQSANILSWLPNWDKTSGKNQLYVFYDDEKKVVQTKYNDEQATYTLEKNYPQDRLIRIVQIWLCIQWTQWMHLDK